MSDDRMDYIDPEEGSGRVLTSLAEQSLLEEIISLSANILEEIQNSLTILGKCKNNVLSDVLGSVERDVREVKEKVEEVKERALRYLVRVPPGIMKDTFGQIILGLTNVAQYVDGSMYRLALLISKEKSSPLLVESTSRLLSLLYDQSDNLYRAFKAFQIDPLKALSLVEKSIEIEEMIDKEYRSTLYDVLESLHEPAAAVLGWEILGNLEDASDLAKDVAEYFKYFILHKVE